jgi:hypothetical protein
MRSILRARVNGWLYGRSLSGAWWVQPYHPTLDGSLAQWQLSDSSMRRHLDGGQSMAAVGRYDGSLQMFVVEPGEVKRTYLRFLRWLVERERLEHPACGPSSGAFAEADSRPAPNRACVPRWFGR